MGAVAKRPEPFAPTVVDELAAIEAGLGGRRVLCGLLALAPLTEDLKYLLGLLGDPKVDLTLAACCSRVGVLPSTLIQHLGAAALTRGQLLAKQAIGDGLVAVAKDIMRRAAPYEDTCYSCRGLGTVTPDPTREQPNPAPVPCELCAGGGKLQYQPELARQELAIDMGQLLPKSAGVQIANIHAAPAKEETVEDLLAWTDTLLYGDGRAQPPAIEADAVEEVPPEDQGFDVD